MSTDSKATTEDPGHSVRRWFYALFTICLSLSISLYAAEWLLSYQRHTIETSDQLQPGMIVYDPRLGLRLLLLYPTPIIPMAISARAVGSGIVGPGSVLGFVQLPLPLIQSLEQFIPHCSATLNSLSP